MVIKACRRCSQIHGMACFLILGQSSSHPSYSVARLVFAQLLEFQDLRYGLAFAL